MIDKIRRTIHKIINTELTLLNWNIGKYTLTQSKKLNRYSKAIIE